MTQFYHLFPFERVPQGVRLIIYGAGEVGQWYLAQMEQTGYAKVLAIADKAWDKYPPMGVPLIAPQDIARQEYDYVLVSIEKPDVARAVANELQTVYGMQPEKIILGSESLCVVPKFMKAGRDMPKLAFEPQGIAVALYMNGGVGDCIVYKRKLEELLTWDSRIVVDLFVTEKMVPGMEAYFAGEFPGRVNAIIVGGEQKYKAYKDKYAIAFSMLNDLEIDVINEQKLAIAPSLLERCLRIKEQSEAFGHITSNLFPLHYARCKKDGLNCYTAYNRYDGFDIKDWHTRIPLRREYEEKYKKLCLTGKYITVNYGFAIHGDVVDCKAWPLKYFEKLIIYLHERFPGVKVVQVAGPGFPELAGCDVRVMGQSLEFVKYVLRGSLCHIDVEGGLVHLATQLGTRCVVMSGPTPLHYYGYKENVNIQAGTCHDCYWFTTAFWRCYRQMAEPECMYSITPELVMEHVEREFGEVLRN